MRKQKYNCIIVDDEPIARKIIFSYVNQMSNLTCKGEFKNAIEALSFLENHNEETIVFLDINMPNMSGLAMTKILNPKHQVILTTAYSEYAVQSYEFNVVDYLLKPFKFDRFALAVFKAIKLLKNSQADNKKEELPINAHINIKSKGENFQIQLDTITYCEAQKNYTSIILKDGRSFSKLASISKFEEELNSRSDYFIRIHRSYIISRNHITSIGSNFVMLANKKLPIGRQYKDSFFSQFDIR